MVEQVARGVVVSACLLVLAGAGSAIGGSRAATPPSAGKIVFSRTSDEDANYWESTAVWTVNGDGTGLVQVSHPPKGSGDHSPMWSPDRKQVAFFRYQRIGEDFRGDPLYRPDLIVMGADGSRLRRLISGAHNGFEGPAWSPDGRHLAFLRAHRGARWIWTIRMDGSAARRLVTGADIRDPVWAPSGREIAFSRLVRVRQEAFVTDASGRRQRKLLPTSELDTTLPVAWSPDGRQVALVGDASEVGDGVVDMSLYLVSRSGRGLRKVVGDVANAGGPEWSPDGRRLLIMREPSSKESWPPTVFVVDAARGRLRRVASGAIRPDWSPDGRRISFVKTKQGDLHVVNTTGGPSRRIARDALSPDW